LAYHEFKYRDYQIEDARAFFHGNYRNFILLKPRQCGKDFEVINMVKQIALTKTQRIAYIFPTYAMARGAMWRGMSVQGINIMDYFPDEICKKNNTEMIVTFLNGSQVQFFGSDNYNRMRGYTFHGAVFSEYAYQDPRGYLDVISPILANSGGWAIFASTPNGKNHYYDLYQSALKDPNNWYTVKQTVDDTKHLSAEQIEIEKNKLSDEMFLQEYYTSFECGAEGSVYSKYINKMYLEHRAGKFYYDPSKLVHTAWDIGVVKRTDTTTIVFFQIDGNGINVIDSYENFRQGASHYVDLINSKKYTYGKHCLPHDVANFEWGSGATRIEQLEELGITVERIPRIKHKMDGIEKVRTVLPRVSIDEDKCEKLLRALNDYHYKWDAVNSRYLDHEPVHNWASNFCDAVMYMCLSLDYLEEDYTADKLEEIETEAMYSSLGPRSYGYRG